MGRVAFIECIGNTNDGLAAGATLDTATGRISGRTSVQYRVYTCGCVGPAMIFDEIANNPDLELPVLGDAYTNPCCDEIISGELIATSWNLVSGPVTVNQAALPDAAQSLNITCCYTFQFDYTKPKPPEEEEQNPVNLEFWCPKLSQTSIAEEVAAESAYFKGMYQADSIDSCDPCSTAPEPTLTNISTECVTRTIGKCGKIINTAGEEFSPPLTKTRRLKQITIEWPALTCQTDAADCLLDEHNCADLAVVLACPIFNKTYAKQTLKLIDSSCDSELLTYTIPSTGIDTTVAIWRNRLTFLWDPRGHCRDILNAGTQRRNCAESDEPCCADATQTSTPCFSPILDVDGAPVTEPVPLDPDGMPLGCNEDPYYLRYATENCNNAFASVFTTIANAGAAFPPDLDL